MLWRDFITPHGSQAEELAIKLAPRSIFFGEPIVKTPPWALEWSRRSNELNSEKTWFVPHESSNFADVRFIRLGNSIGVFALETLIFSVIANYANHLLLAASAFHGALFRQQSFGTIAIRMALTDFGSPSLAARPDRYHGDLQQVTEFVTTTLSP